jgi:hypothetical protein
MVGIRYSLFVPGEQRHVVAYLDGLYPGGHLRQAKVNALREWWSSSPTLFAERIELQPVSGDTSQVAPKASVDAVYF